jgi:hypothetical protein
VTGGQILAAFESIGAVVRLTPAGVVDVDSPEVPELEKLIAEVKANRAEVVAELRRHAPPFTAPGREPERPCLGCLRAECREGELFHDEACFARWKAQRDERRRKGDTRGQAPSAIRSHGAAWRDAPAPGSGR